MSDGDNLGDIDPDALPIFVNPENEHPELPGYWHENEVAPTLNISSRRLRQLTSEGHLPQNKKAYWPLLQTVTAYAMYCQARMGGRTASERNKEDAELKRERHRKLRIENDLRMGELVEISQVESIFWECMTTLGNVLDGAAGRMAGGDALLRKRLLDEHRRIRDQFADRLETFVDGHTRRKVGATAADSGTLGVGGSETDSAERRS